MLTIDGISYDAYVVHKDYDMQKKDEYGGTEYTDGWWKAHRTVVRTKISGKATLAMRPSVYNDFITALNNNVGVDGDHTVSAFVLNTGTTETFTAYIGTTAKAAISTPAFGSNAVFFNVTLTIEER